MDAERGADRILVRGGEQARTDASAWRHQCRPWPKRRGLELAVDHVDAQVEVLGDVPLRAPRYEPYTDVRRLVVQKRSSLCAERP
jgi:hypothetical protein